MSSGSALQGPVTRWLAVAGLWKCQKALSPTIYPQATPCKAQSQDDWALPALPEGLVTNNIRRQCPARSSHKMTGPCRALPEGLVTNNNIRRQCPARPGDYKMTWALSGFAGVLLPTIISAGNALQGLVTKMTWTLPGFAAIAYFHPQYHPQATPCKALSLRWHGPARVLQEHVAEVRATIFIN